MIQLLVILLLLFQLPDDGKDDWQWMQSLADTGFVELEPGVYELSKPLVFTAKERSTQVQLLGAGRQRTKIVAKHTDDAAIKFATEAGGVYEYSEVAGFTLWVAAKNKYGILLDRWTHSTVEQLRVIGGTESACSVGYSYSNVFDRLLLQHAGVGLEFTNAVNNHNSVLSCILLANGIGLKINNGGVGITIVGTGLESNRQTGLLAKGVNGLVISGGYVESNAPEGYKFSHIESKPQEWITKADYIFAGIGPNGTQSATSNYSCVGVSVSGVGGTKSHNAVDFCFAGIKHSQVQAIGTPSQVPTVETYYDQERLSVSNTVLGRGVRLVGMEDK